MGRRRKTPKHKQKRAKWYQKENEWGDFVFDWSLGLSGESWREILAIIILVFAAVVIAGFFGSAGRIGMLAVALIRRLFGGVSAYFAAAIIFYLGFILLIPPKSKNKQSPYRLSKFMGIIIFLIALPLFLHLFVPVEESKSVALFGGGGGEIGFLFSQPLRNQIGLFPTFIVSVSLIVLSLVFAFNLSLSKHLTKNRAEDEEEEEGKVPASLAARVSVFESVRRRLNAIKKQRSESGRAAPVVEVAASGNAVLPKRQNDNWEYPSVEILKGSNEVANPGNLNKNAETIQKTLKNFGIDVGIGEANIGPTVTQYTLKPNEGVKLNNIVARQNDLALALSAKSLRVEAPIPGKNLVGIEIPNKVAAKVTLKEVLISPQFRAQNSKLAIALGRDVAGEPVAINLERMPHLLIAGATGSGKSVCINSIITAFLFNNSPQNLRLILIDPKRVELTNYNNIPHLLTSVICDVEKTVSALRWTVYEMERRYELFSRSGKRNIVAYNQAPSEEGTLPYIVIIIDELADLMATSAKEVEGSIVRLAQMARATGIHLVVATQRPSVDVLTGLIKANITSRVAFATASQVDSRTILDFSGAEKLLGNGDMLFSANGVEKPRRIQGCFVSDVEIEELNNFLRQRGGAQYDESILNFRPARTGNISAENVSAEDTLYDEATEIVIRAGKASASLLQRRLRIGYARAARLLDLLEEAGVIGPADGAKPRDVLVSGAGAPDFNTDFSSSREDNYQ